MSAQSVIFLMIAGCGAAALLIFREKALKPLGRLCLRSVAGGLGVYILNAALAALGVAQTVGLNAVSVLFVGFLGFPGFATLYVAGYLLPK